MNYKEEYARWLKSNEVDENTKSELIKLSEKETEDRFYRMLEFGTGGLRGVMASGTNRMNIYTIRLATKGLSKEISALGTEAKNKGIVIAYDSRNNSFEFAQETAKVLCSEGIRTYLFESLRPTPELSFAVRYLGCVRGIVITASHNPKEYNGYKVYDEDGGQIPPETANKIISYINSTDIFDDIRIKEELKTEIIGKDVDEAYIKAVKEQSFGVKIPDDFKIIYTPLHGSGNIPVRSILAEIGCQNVIVVPEQELPDGSFPTVISPNPENPEAFNIAVKYGEIHNADLILGTDPDCDRIGVAVKNISGRYEVLSGNQTGALLCEYILRKLKEHKKLPENPTIIKTIVTTEMVRVVAEEYGAIVIDVLTGFKFIGEKIKEFDMSDEINRFVFGLEESYGYLRGTYARDKDAVVAAMLIAEMAADYKANGMTLYEGLMLLYKKYGYYKEQLKTKTLSGIDGMNRIKRIMAHFRNKAMPMKIYKMLDYKNGIDGLPCSDVLKFFTEDGWFAVRPSGTEPKIKFYFGIKGKNSSDTDEKLTKLVNAVMNISDEV